MAKQWTPRRIRSEEDRGSGSSTYISLTEGENFLGYALFEADPKVDDPAYYEYAEHWLDKKSVPCAGDDCPLCADGDRPKTRAKSVWLVEQDENGRELDPAQIRIFNLNYSCIKEFTAYRAEGEKIKGRKFRVTRTDDRGGYSFIPKTDSITAAAVKTALKDKAAPDLEEMLTAQLRKAMEGIVTQHVMEADEEPEAEEPEEEQEKPAAKGKTAGKGKSSSKKADWPDELEEATVTVEIIDGDGNYFTAANDEYDGTKNVYTTAGIEFDLTTLSEGDLVTVSAALDGDGDYVLSAEPDTDGAGGDSSSEETDKDELPDSVEEIEMKIAGVNTREEILDLTSDEYTFTLFFLDTMKPDFDDYKVDQTIIVTAEKDSMGDMVATEIPKIKGAAKRKVAAGAKGK